MTTAIYTAFLEALESQPGGALLAEDLQLLRSKRGLMPETCIQSRLASGRRERIKKAVEQLKDKFPIAQLDQAGITHQGKPHLRWSEDQDAPQGKIIIPYLSRDGKDVLYLRAHKSGPAGVDLEVYGQHCASMVSADNPIALTEGEYKALALHQCGVPALAIPGISSFGGKHFERLIRVLRDMGAVKVVILFDNEIKDDPSLPSYKPDPLKRWDTDYWACRMARQLYRAEGISSALIARLPDEWRQNGKIDPDGALAAGRTPDELREVIRQATIADRYLEQLPEEARIVIGYKHAKDQLFFSPLKEERGIYRWKAGENYEDLSNFLFQPGRRIRRADGKLKRIYIATNTQNEPTEVELDAGDLAAPGAFKKKLLEAGNLRWSGNQTQLDYLQERLFILASPRIANETDRFGRLDDDAWAFGDGIIDPSGQLHSLGEDGVVWGSGLHGTIPLDDHMCPRPQMIEIEGSVPTLLDVYDPLMQSLGSPAIGLGLGWLLGCVWSNEIFSRLGSYPILGVFGKYQAGKTTLGRWLTGGWGIPEHGQNPVKFDGTSAKGMERTLAKYGSMPVWVDEFRNGGDAKEQAKQHALRSVYDRSSSVQAEFSNDLKTRGAQIRGCLILSGEEAPIDPALMSRLVQIRTREEQRGGALKDFEAAKGAAARLPLLTRDCIQHRTALWPQVITCIDRMHDRLGPMLKDERLAWLYSVPLGVFLALLSPAPAPDNKSGQAIQRLTAWVQEELDRIRLEKKEEDHLTRFWKGVGILTRRFGPGGTSLVNKLHLAVSKDKKTLYFRMEDIYQIYAEMAQRSKGPPPLAEATLRNYLFEAPFVRRNDKGSFETLPRKHEGKTIRFMMMDLMHPDVPWPARELADQMHGNKNWDQQVYAAEIPDDNFESQVDFIEEKQPSV